MRTMVSLLINFVLVSTAAFLADCTDRWERIGCRKCCYSVRLAAQSLSWRCCCCWCLPVVGRLSQTIVNDSKSVHSCRSIWHSDKRDSINGKRDNVSLGILRWIISKPADLPEQSLSSKWSRNRRRIGDRDGRASNLHIRCNRTKTAQTANSHRTTDSTGRAAISDLQDWACLTTSRKTPPYRRKTMTC